MVVTVFSQFPLPLLLLLLLTASLMMR